MEKLIIVDSNGIAYMAKYSMKGLNFDFMETGVIFGFLKQIKKIAKLFNTTKFIFCWDSKKSIRRELYPEYKSHRRAKRNERTPEEIIEDNLAFQQFYLLRKNILPKIGFNNIFIRTGFESDDIIASLVFNKSLQKYDKIIVSNDEDLYQLLDSCSMYNPKTEKIITAQTFNKEYNIFPKDWIMVKMLGGCTSDNVKGVLGVGEKTAIKYINKQLTKGKVLDRIVNLGPEVIKQNAMLVGLPLIGTEPKGGFEFKKDNFTFDGFIDVCEQYGFQSFLKKEELTEWKNLFNME